LLLLKENLRLWKEHQIAIENIEKQIEILLDEMIEDKSKEGKEEKIIEKSPSCPARHHNPDIDGLHRKLVCLFGGVNLTTIAGINDSTMLRLLGEIGTDSSRFPTQKHFVSWLGLSPKSKQSGTMKRRISSGKSNIAGEIFRQSAQALSRNKYSAIGSFIRRLKGKKGAQIAIKAGERKIAIAFYNALTHGMDYVEAGTAKYQKQIIERELKTMKKLALKYNFQLTEYV
jgi:transposase